MRIGLIGISNVRSWVLMNDEKIVAAEENENMVNNHSPASKNWRVLGTEYYNGPASGKQQNGGNLKKSKLPKHEKTVLNGGKINRMGKIIWWRLKDIFLWIIQFKNYLLPHEFIYITVFTFQMKDENNWIFRGHELMKGAVGC